MVDVVDLERRLDSVWMGYWKVRVNSPKYNRNRERFVRNVEPKPKDSRDRVPRRKWDVEPNVSRSHFVWKENAVVEKGGKGKRGIRTQ